MAITVSVTESSKQIIAGIPEYIEVTVDAPSNVFYTTDGSVPDPSGNSLTTFIMEHEPGNALQGIIFLPTNANLLDLNILAVGVPDTNTGTFYRRYGLDPRHIGIGRPGIKKPIPGGTSYGITVSPNTATDGQVISPDGYTQGSTTHYKPPITGFDGYSAGYEIATSGEQAAIPTPAFDHIDGYGGDGNVISTTTLTPGQEQYLVKESNTSNAFEDDGNGKVGLDDLPQIDPRSTRVKDSNDDENEVVPVQFDLPSSDYEDAPIQDTTTFTNGGFFNPRALYIEIDGRVDGYINGKQIQPGDRHIVNKPYGSLRQLETREDLGDAVRTTLGYISGGLVCPIYDYARGQAQFAYWDNHDNRWVISLQKITPPQYDIVYKRNGVVVAHVFKWVWGKRSYPI